MEMINILKAIILGIVEGITEWLPISSTGHMILVDEFLHLDMSAAFKEMFLVVIQLGAIMAVVVLYWRKLIPISKGKSITINKDTVSLWFKIAVSCVPAAVIGLLYNDQIDALFYNYQTVAAALIFYGILFIIIENKNKNKNGGFRIGELSQITYKTAFLIGIFQLLSLIPGTSRSGATILGAILLGTSRTVAAEFTFFLAIPVMFGASFIKLLKFGFSFTNTEVAVLLAGAIVAFVVSVIAIKFLINYIKKNDFKAFGWYRIVLGILIIIYFTVIK